MRGKEARTPSGLRAYNKETAFKTTDPGPSNGPFSRGRKMASELNELTERMGMLLGALVSMGFGIGMTSGIDAAFMNMVGIVLFLVMGVPSLIFLGTRSCEFDKFLESCPVLFWLAVCRSRCRPLPTSRRRPSS